MLWHWYNILYIRYIKFWNVEFLNNVVIIKSHPGKGNISRFWQSCLDTFIQRALQYWTSRQTCLGKAEICNFAYRLSVVVCFEQCSVLFFLVMFVNYSYWFWFVYQYCYVVSYIVYVMINTNIGCQKHTLFTHIQYRYYIFDLGRGDLNGHCEVCFGEQIGE